MLRVRLVRTFSLITALGTGLGLGGCLDTHSLPFSRLHVAVRTQDGTPIPNVRVEAIGGIAWERPRAVEYTNAEGRVEMSVPIDFVNTEGLEMPDPRADYVIRAYAPDSSWSPAVASREIVLRERDSTEYVLVLTPPTSSRP